MFTLFQKLIAENFLPHAWCLRASGVLWVHAASDILTAVAYVMIPMALASFFRRRRDLQFSWIFVLFGIFILSCGLTHVLAAWTLWHPIYRLEALVKAITAATSVLTAAMLWTILPKLLALPSPEQLRREIDERTAAEFEIRRLNVDLERKVSERTAALRTANSQLKITEERLSLALEVAAIGIWDEDLESGQFFENYRYRCAFGFNEDRFSKHDEHLAAVHPEDREHLHQAMETALSPDGSGNYDVDIRTYGVDDKVLRYLHTRGRVFFQETPAGRAPVRIIRTLLDVTGRRRVEAALLRSNHDLRQFAFAAAHDLQEPLRNIAVSIELLSMKYSGLWDEDANELIASSVEGAQRVHRMLQDLLGYARVIDSPENVLEPADTHAALERALANLQSRINESGAFITTGLLPHLRASEIHLTQLFQNLVGNSIKYRDASRTLHIRIDAQLQQDGWLFQVTDNGIGFEPVYAERIFSVFKRLHTRDEYPGNGIGLAICSRIVSHYGGSICAEGRPGNGATFRFLLPV